MATRSAPESQPCPLCDAEACRHAEVSSGTYFRCGECDLISQWRAELPGREAEFAHYGTHENSPDDPGYRRFLDRLARPLFELLPVGAQGLDYGCGPGPALSVMAREAGFGMADYDPFFADRPELLQRRYDFVTCTEAVEHFHHPRTEFDRIAGMLRPGGYLGLMTELHDTGGDFGDWWYHRDPTHVNFLSSRTVEWLAERYGWQPRFRVRAVTILQSAS